MTHDHDSPDSEIKHNLKQDMDELDNNAGGHEHNIHEHVEAIAHIGGPQFSTQTNVHNIEIGAPQPPQAQFGPTPQAYFEDIVEKLKVFGTVMNFLSPVENAEARELDRILGFEREQRAALERDLANLKHKITTLSRMPHQVSDAELKDRMEDLHQQAHSWVKNFRKLQPPPYKKSAMSQSSRDLLALFNVNLPVLSQALLLKLGHAIVGRVLKDILGHFYFGLENDKRPGTILELSEFTNGTKASFIINLTSLLTICSHRYRL